MTATLLQPWALLALYVWSFGVLSAAQLTIRLIMAYSVRLTLAAAVVLSAGALVVAGIYDIAFDTPRSLATRLELIPVTMLMMALVGFGVAHWVLRIRRLRGQLVAAVMVGLLDPHLFTLLSA